MSLFGWLGKVIRLTDAPFWGMYYGGMNWAGKAVTEENSLNISAWWRSIRLYADVTGSLPLKMYERVGTNGDERRLVRDHNLSDILLISPNSDQTPQEFWSAMAAGLAMFGNAFAEKKMRSDGSLIALDLLPCSTTLTRSHSKDGSLEYCYVEDGKTVYLPREKVFHVRGFMFGRSDAGLSPLAAARQGLSLSLATEEATAQTFAQGLRVSGFFTGQELKTAQREQFVKTYIDPITGNDAKNHYGILPPGFDFKPINIPPKDAEMLLSRRFNIEEICRFMGVPPIMVGHHADGQTAWGTGVESIINSWLTLGYNSFLRYIESAINRWLLAAGDRKRYYVEYERNALLRMDSQARAEFISKMIQNAQMTPNEGRKADNRPPMDGGDKLLVNSALVPLVDAGKQLKLGSAPQPSPVGG